METTAHRIGLESFPYCLVRFGGKVELHRISASGLECFVGYLCDQSEQTKAFLAPLIQELDFWLKKEMQDWEDERAYQRECRTYNALCRLRGL